MNGVRNRNSRSGLSGNIRQRRRDVRGDAPRTSKNGSREEALPDDRYTTERRVNDSLEKVFGKHSVRAVFINRPSDVREMFIAGREEYHEEFTALAEENGVPVTFLDWPKFLCIGEFTEDDRHQGIVVFTKPKTIYGDKDIERLASARCVILLDQLSNPQNLATIIRCGAFFGVNGVILMKNRAAELTSTVIRYAVGGVEFVDIYEITNVSRTLSNLKKLGFWAYGLDERGETTLGRTEFAEKCVLVIGAEGEGLRLKTRKYCDLLVRIPGGRRGLESINAAVAASIAMAEFYRLDE